MSGKPVRETSSTKYYGKITVYRYEDAWNPEQTETYSESFEATSIQSAKAKLTKIANAQELFSWVQSWDNENADIYRKRPTLETLESARFLRAERWNPYRL